MQPDFTRILEQFAISHHSTRRHPEAELTHVYTVNNTHMLKGRPCKPNILEEFFAAQEVLSKVRPQLQVKIPEFLTTKKGMPYVIHQDIFWTLYEKIPGSIICSWREMAFSTPQEKKCVFSALRTMHKATPNICKNAKATYLQEKQEAYTKIRDSLAISSQNRIEKAIQHVENHKPTSTCFIHGDFHPGNLVVDNKLNVVGILDLDWCRIGNYLEDLAYTVMMYLRKFQNTMFTFNESEYKYLLTLYPYEKEHETIFADYMILSIMFDVYVFQYITDIKDNEKLLAYQTNYLETMCRII